MDPNKTFAHPKIVRPLSKRPPATASKSKNNEPPKKETNAASRKSIIPSKINLRANATVIGDEIMFKQEDSTLDLDATNAEIAYGKFMRTMLEECLLNEKIDGEETQMDLQMAQLADRFQKTVDQLDKTNRRLKDISFFVEQKRLLDLKTQDCSNFYDLTENSGIEDTIDNVKLKEQACLDKLQTKNVDFGFDNESGHRQLLDAVNDAIEGLESIKKKSNLDMDKFKEYENSRVSLDELEKCRFNMECLKTEFENKFPKFSEKLLKEVSEKIEIMENDDTENE